MKRLINLVLCLLVSFTAVSKDKLSLLDFGWAEATTGIQKAKVIYEAQEAAIKCGKTVDYSGIKEVHLEISKDFKSIPLTGEDDFSGIVFYVKNVSKNIALFKYMGSSKSISISGHTIDEANFSRIPELCSGEKLLIIEDKNPWVDNRVGYNYGHTRKDILLLKDGKSENKVVAPYNNAESDPVCSFIDIRSRLYVKSFTLNRDPSSTKMTFCLSIQGAAHVLIKDIAINTPANNLANDYAIRIYDCADVALEDVCINNTYSQSDKYGYGINCDNTWNTRFIRVCGNANWGIMGNNNMSDTYLVDCKINRFDIHCYGRNVFMNNCIIDGGLNGWYCGGSSIFGTIKYDNCTFKNCVPIAYGESYKIAVGANVVFNDCSFYLDKKHNSIFSTGVLNRDVVPRKGYMQKSIPNIEINRITIYVPKDVVEMYLYYFGKGVKYKGSVGFIKSIKIKDIKFICEDANHNIKFILSSIPIKTDNKQSIDVSKVSAPNVILCPQISRNRRNKINLSNADLYSIEVFKNNIELKTNNCNLHNNAHTLHSPVF